MQRALIGLGAVAVALGAVLIFMSRLSGGTDAIEAVPADAHAVAFFDLAEIHEVLTSERVAGLLGEIDPKLAEIDATLDEEFGLTISDDVLPWVGSTAAIWASSDSDHGKGCLVVSARNRAAADDFVAAVVTLDDFPDSTSRPVDGGTLHETDAEDGKPVAIGRVEGVVLFCGGEGAADASLAALAGTSMADNTEVAGLAGDGNLVVGWLDFPALAEIGGEMEESSFGIDPAELAPAVVTFDVTDRGFEWSMDTPSTFGVEMADDSLASALPAGTLLAFFGGIPDIDVPALADGTNRAGVDPSGLLRLMDGPVALGVASDDESIISQMFEVPLDLVLTISSSDPVALAAEVKGLVEDSLGMTEEAFTEEAYPGGTLYTLAFPFIGDLATMAVTDDYVTISASAEAARGEGPRLIDSALWQEATSALVPGSEVSFFFDLVGFREIDLAALIEMAESSMEERVDAPEDAPGPADLLAVEQVQMIVAGTSTDGSSIRAELVILVDWGQ